jgi:hypothetical protein
LCQKVELAEALDTAVTNGLSLAVNLKEEVRDASILYEMQSQEGNEESQDHYNEEQKARYAGNMSNLWHQDVQDREELG